MKTNARIIAATNRNLQDMVQRQAFRRDLYYRINIISVELPPLRERREDIELLAEKFIVKMNRRKARMISGLTDEALEVLQSHEFPGNIRELENIIEHAFVLCRGERIEPNHLPAYLSHRPEGPAEAKPSGSIKTVLAERERDTILQALEYTRYNRAAAARYLGMHKSTLFRKLKKLNLTLPARDGRNSG